VIPAQSEKIQDILQDIWNKNRTSDRTSEACFATLVRHYCISAVMPQYSEKVEMFAFIGQGRYSLRS